jgi:hypothetical protein
MGGNAPRPSRSVRLERIAATPAIDLHHAPLPGIVATLIEAVAGNRGPPANVEVNVRRSERPISSLVLAITAVMSANR